MCVIIIKTAGHKLPKKSELKAAYKRNPDGCGFVSESMSYKSLDFEDFYQHIKDVPKDENCIIHFRWATQGSVSEDNCHPFYDQETNTWFAHNGCLPYHPKEDITDSEFAFRKKLVPSLKVNGLYSQAFARDVNNIIGGSKFAFMQNGQLKCFGRFIEYGGCYYSNLHHLSTPLWCTL